MAIDINSLQKRYADPWATSFEYVDANGNVLGKGYDTYQDAISKLAFKGGLLELPELAGTGILDQWGNPTGTNPVTPGGFTHEAYYTPATSWWDTEGGGMSAPEVRGPTFATKQELYDYMLKDAEKNLPLSYDSREKYGRKLTEGQLQNMYAQYANGLVSETVPDWDYHRAAYLGGKGRVSGADALVGSEPVFGNDGRVIGYKVNSNPVHINLADTSGKVTSSTSGSTSWNPELTKYGVNLGDGKFFIESEDVDKLWYDSNSSSTYNKADNFVEKMMPAVAMAALGMGASGLFSPAAAAAGAGEAALGTGITAGGGGLGFTGAGGLGLTGDIAGLGSMGFGGSTAAGLTGTGLGAGWGALGGAASNVAGGGGMFDDIFSWLSDSFGDAASGGSEFASQDIVDLFNNAGTEGFNQYGVSLDDLATQLFDQAGTAGFDQYGNEAFGLDWLKSQLPSGTSSDTIGKLGKVLFGGGGPGAGGGLLGGGGSPLGALLGGLAGSYNGAKQDGTINTTQTPWGPQQPYLLDAWEKAKQASNNPINTQAQSNYQSVLQGPTTNPYLGQDNPYLQKQIDNTNDDVTRAMMPAMNQANKASGSFGNSGVADIYSKNMTDAYSRNANDMRFKDYYAQMQLQKDAVNNTLGFTQGSSAFNAAPAQDYAKTIQGNYGGTKSEPYFTNPASSILGGATLGYNLFGR